MQLSAAAGNLALYTGVWRSDCGMAYLAGKVHSVINEYHLHASTGKVMTATLMQYQFSDNNCRDAMPGLSGVPQARQSQVITVGEVIDVVPSSPSAVAGPFVGTADRVHIQIQSESKTSYIAFSESWQRMHLTTELPFSTMALTYKKL